MKTPLQVGERVKHPHHKEIEVLRPTHTPIQDVQRTVLGLYIAETLLQGKGEEGGGLKCPDQIFPMQKDDVRAIESTAGSLLI